LTKSNPVMPRLLNRGLNAICASVSLIVLVASSSSLSTANPYLQSGDSHRTTRVLFIGNSYTYFNNLPMLLAGLAASDAESPKIEAEMVVRGGATLKQHWDDGKALAKLKSGQWDYVVLQDQSTLPITEPATMYKYARLFAAEIKKTNGRLVFFLTWARQNKPETQAALNNAYFGIAHELGALVAPVGVAWQKALAGSPTPQLYMLDQSHPNQAGSYLAACVFYSVITGKSPMNLACKVSGNPVSVVGTVSPERGELVKLQEPDCEFLKRTAWEAFQKSASQAPANN